MIDRNDIDGYAAEYVLGTLDHFERVEIAALRASEFAMDEAVTAWEKRFAPLNEITPEVAPSPDLFAKIELRISALTFPSLARLSQRNPRRRWQGLALAVSLAFLIIAGVVFMQTTLSPQFVAVLSAGPAKPMFVVSLDKKDAMIRVHRLTKAAPSDKSYELWMIPAGEKTPHSLGILSNMDAKLPIIAGLNPAAVINSTLAISVEPLGGSPTHAPTGPVIVTGKFRQTAL